MLIVWVHPPPGAGPPDAEAPMVFGGAVIVPISERQFVVKPERQPALKLMVNVPLC
jgi:hypothetical protein